MTLETEIMQSIAHRIEKSVTAGSVTIVTPKGSVARTVTISQIRFPGVVRFQGYVNISDFTDIWARVISSSIKTNAFEMSNTFVRLMGLEVGLRWRGPFYRKASFDVNPRLSEIAKHVPELKTDKRLSEALNSDRELMNRIHAAKPARVESKLAYFPTYYPKGPFRDRGGELESFLEYVREPDKIIWETDVLMPMVMKDRSVDKTKALDSLDIINEVAKKSVQITGDVVMSL